MDRLRFNQRIGTAPIPSQLKRDELSVELQARVWAVLYSSMKEAKVVVDYGSSVISGSWRHALYAWHVYVLHQPADEFSSDYAHSVAAVRAIIYSVDYTWFFTFIEHLVRINEFPSELNKIAFVLGDCKAGWRIVGDEIVPFTSEEEAQTVSEALSEIRSTAPEGAKAHLAQASRLLGAGDWAGSVRESIHAVEATALSIKPGGTLADALKAIGKHGQPVHPALSQACLKLYGYTSDEQGIRHALVDGQAAQVTENEAIFMYASCVSFAQYLIRATR